MLSLPTRTNHIITGLKEYVSWLEPTAAPASLFLGCNNSMLSLQATTEPYQYWIERSYFETGTNNCSNNRVLKLQRFHVVTANQNLTISLLVWKNLFRSWNQRLLQQPCSEAATTPCCHCKPQPNHINTGLKESTSKLEQTTAPTTVFLSCNHSMLSLPAKT